MTMFIINNQLPIQEVERDGFQISTDPTRLDLAVIHQFLANEAYWSPGVSQEKVARQMQFSLCFGVYQDKQQVGFARVISDFTTFAYVADVFVLRSYRGRDLGKWLVQTILCHPELQNLRKFTLNTEDAHTLYRQFGFDNDPKPENYLVFRPSS